MNLTNIKGAVFFDLDGTLLNDRSRIDDEVAQAITQLKENQILPVICTGRSPQEIQHAQEMTSIETVITLNGSLVKNSDEIVYQRVIPTALLDQVIGFANSSNTAVSMYNDKQIYSTTDSTNEIIESHKLIAEPIPEVNPDFYKDHDISMLVVYTKESADVYTEQFGTDMTFYKTGAYSIDCVMKNETKKTGIQHLLKELQLTDIPTYAFGDGPNDVEMLGYVDHPVVMGNAGEDIFQYAEFITTKNTDHGIVNGLKHFDLI
ncbi:Cof-type HAD-IIB family hydrolase [Lactobacillus sp. YT155]|uniref:Cof-type HAD-IIB family hydrolase n=1 Tax=Lactobacillus sp. YT155 TaxID=3060955 RepID=UPI00265E6278|nr:Cof-type HAD-IIB family hydrolase [Lactobacillus sp. YT155]MDO1605041.1 Cof-type HAD-IIB family hydrolase [Lactobacillus sp. YT155]